MAAVTDVTDRDYARLLAVRTTLRRFEQWSAEQAAQQGLTARQHQLLLAVQGHRDAAGPTIGQVGDYLMIRHHSAVELVSRCESAGLLVRVPDRHDGRVVRLRLTALGRRRLRALASAHIEELSRLARVMGEVVAELRRP